MPERFANLADGDELRHGGYPDARRRHAGAHTPGHQCLYLPDQKIMFFGDHVLMNSSPNMAPFPARRIPGRLPAQLGQGGAVADRVRLHGAGSSTLGARPRPCPSASPGCSGIGSGLDEIAAQLEERPA